MLKHNNFEQFVRFSSMPIILDDVESILKNCFPKGEVTSPDEEFLKEYFAIGCWCNSIIPRNLLSGCMANIAKRFHKVLSTDKIVDKADSLMVLSIYPDIKELGYDIMEIIMPLVRFYNWQVIKSELLETYKGEEVHCLTLQKTNIINYKALLLEHQILDYTASYTVDVERNKLVSDLKFKVLGLMADDKRKLSRQICKAYPDLKYGKGERPGIELECVDFKNDTYKDPNAVAIHIVLKDKKFQIGWLGTKIETILEGTDVTPNVFISSFMKRDAYKREQEEKIIQHVKLFSFGSMVKDGKTIYYGKIIVTVDVNNIKQW